MTVIDLIQPSIPTFNESDDTQSVAQTIISLGYSHAVIADTNGLFIGYASLDSLGSKKTASQAVEIALASNVFLAHTHLYEAVPVFYKSNMQHIAIVDNKNKLLGIADHKNINHKLIETLTYRGNGAILVLKIFHRDFVLSRIANIVEENNARIVGMMIEEIEPHLYVSLKLNTLDIEPIRASLQRFDIVIDKFYSPNSHQEGINKEFDIALRHFDF